MKLITEPKVYLIGKQIVVDEELDRFLADHEVSHWKTDTGVGAEKICEVNGRLCYTSYAKPRPGGNSAYLNHIKEVGHGSVIEAAVWNFVFTGVSRSLTHELVRHRAGTAFSQLSQRYVDESIAEYVVPPDLRLEVLLAKFMRLCNGNKAIFDNELADTLPELVSKSSDELMEMINVGYDWLEAVETSHKNYKLVSNYLAKKAEGVLPDAAPTDRRKFARQAARSVLPNATETKIAFTANARALRHCIEMRCSRFADPEIRVLFGMVWEVLIKESPNLFGDYVKTELPDGTFELTTPYRKV